MLNIVLGILCFNLILVLFKLFDRYKVNTLQAILINYFTAGSMGLILSKKAYSINSFVEAPWLPFALIIGLLFISVFTFLAIGAQKIGIAISTVANKMSVIIPVIAAIFVLGDHITISKSIGILLALIGVYLTLTSKGNSFSFDKKYIWLILFIFVGQGCADVIFNYAQHHYVQEEDAALFFTGLFYAAGIGGIVIFIFQAIRGRNSLQLKSIFWGIAVGIPNYLTLLFFFRALESNILQSSQIYPIFNIGIVILSALTGFFVFKEKLNGLNWIGILISVISIALIGLL